MEKFKTKKYYTIRIVLFVLTLITTTLAGAEWIYGNTFLPLVEHPMGWKEFWGGFAFSIPFMLFLTAHEFGHYLVAIKNKVQVTLPLYLPIWLGFLGLPSFGTVGAFIQLRSHNIGKIKHFDIGIAGPLAGFVVAILVLAIGYTTLPEKSQIYDIHPEYAYFGESYEDYVYSTDTVFSKADFEHVTGRTIAVDTIRFSKDDPKLLVGKNLLMYLMEATIVPDTKLIPHDYELFHNPWLFAGFLGLLFTAINLLPIGQLDGGHILYGMVGYRWHRIIASGAFILFVSYAGLGVVPLDLPLDKFFLYSALYLWILKIMFNGLKLKPMDTWMVAVIVYAVQFVLLYFSNGEAEGFSGWLLFMFLIGKFIGVDHPKDLDQSVQLDGKRKVLGWIALLIFILSFSPTPINYVF